MSPLFFLWNYLFFKILYCGIQLVVDLVLNVCVVIELDFNIRSNADTVYRGSVRCHILVGRELDTGSVTQIVEILDKGMADADLPWESFTFENFR